MSATVQPEASTMTPDPRAQRAAETGDQHTPTALYRLYSTGGTVLYIGISDNPDRRFKQHRDTKPWWPQVAQKTIEWHPNRHDALAEEAAAIAAESPICNIEHNPAAQRGPVSPHHPPADMPTDRVDALRKAASGLPAEAGEELLRAGFEGFARAQLDERATAKAPSTPTDRRDPNAPAFTPDGRQAIQDMVDRLTAGIDKTGDQQTALAKILEGLPRHLPAALPRIFGQHDPEPGHFPWCKPGTCILHQHGNDQWVEHNGLDYHTVIDDHGGNSTLRLVAQLAQDDDFHGPTPVVHLYDENGAGVFLDPPALDKGIAHLEGLVGLLNVLREQMGLPLGDDSEMRERVEGHVDRIMAALREMEPEATA